MHSALNMVVQLFASINKNTVHALARRWEQWGLNSCLITSTHLEHSSVHGRHGSYLIHVSDPKFTHLKNKRGHMKYVAIEEGSKLTEASLHLILLEHGLQNSPLCEVQAKTFSLPTSQLHKAQFSSCLNSFWAEDLSQASAELRVLWYKPQVDD